MDRLWITGPNGFIGRNLVEQLGERYEIRAPNHAQLDLLDPAAVRAFLAENRVDAILHTATHNATRTSTKDVSQVLASNLRMFFNLARSRDLYDRLFFFGSGAEFDLRHYQPRMNEAYFDRFVPEDAYGLSKYIMTQYAQATDRIYNLRIFGCFGRYEDWRIRFISNAICKTLFDRDISMVQNVYFDYLYVDDLVRIVDTVLARPELAHRTYNVCTGSTVDLMTLAQIVRATSGRDVQIRAAEPGLKPEYSGDNQRLLGEIGPIAFTPIEQAIRELYAWYEAHRSEIDVSQLL